jgi:hypothetical protein
MIFIITYIIRRTRQNCEQKQQQSTELKRYQVKITLFHETVPLSYNGFFFFTAISARLRFKQPVQS